MGIAVVEVEEVKERVSVNFERTAPGKWTVSESGGWRMRPWWGKMGGRGASLVERERVDVEVRRGRARVVRRRGRRERERSIVSCGIKD